MQSTTRTSQHQERRLSAVFSALADPTRRAILRELGSGPKSATSFVQWAGMSQPAISRHLRVLREAGLLRSTLKGRVRLCELKGDALRDAGRWMDAHRTFWTQQLEALETFVQGGNSRDESTAKRRKTPRRITR